MAVGEPPIVVGAALASDRAADAACPADDGSAVGVQPDAAAPL